MTTRERYIAAGIITPAPTPLSADELTARGFTMAAAAKRGR